MTRQADAARIGVLGRRTDGHTVRTVLHVSARVTLVGSLTNGTSRALLSVSYFNKDHSNLTTNTDH